MRLCIKEIECDGEDWSSLARTGLVPGCCESSSEPSCSVRDGGVLNYFSDYQLLMKALLQGIITCYRKE